ncbi:MAG: glycosyltransferase family 4 protein, partial [Lachnospiraceae bacterium]|nr:glycosyltransferase family 4 protein [Lachnospiraceae bacterium]
KETPDRVLVGIQGVMEICKDHFFDGVPGRVINRVTFRDFLKKDSLKEQREKYAQRAENEVMALKLIGNVTGRTPFDREFTAKVNLDAKYFFMNETLRKDFYGKSAGEDVEPFSIFLSQGNYPIKGAHFMIMALSELKKDFPDARVYIAGDNITRHKSLKDRIRLSSYGKYLLELIKKYDLWDSVVFTGSLSAEKYAERLMRSSVFVCPSTIENSPNSLGEAMLLSVPCVAARVGGIPGIFDDGKDGILYTPGDVAALCDGIAKIWTDAEARESFVKSAKEHAERTHDPKANFLRLTEIYKEIFDANSICI